MTTPNRKRLFIVGCPRSGTTILQAVLSTHSTVVSFPESNFVRSAIQLQEFYEFANPGKCLRHRISTLKRRLLRSLDICSLDGRTAALKFLKDVGREDLIDLLPQDSHKLSVFIPSFSKILDRLADDHGVDHWIEKTPDHVFYMPWIEKYLDSYKVIHIIRNSEDVTASLYDAAMKYKDQHWNKNYSDIDRCIDRWLISVNASLGYLNQVDHYHVLYNNFMTEPEAGTRDVCDFIGIDYEAKMVEDPFSNSNEIVRSSEKWKTGVTAGAGLKVAPSKFSTVFTQEQQQYIRKRIGDAGMTWDDLVSKVEGK